MSKLGHGAKGVIYKGSTDGGQDYFLHLKDGHLYLEVWMTDSSVYELKKSKNITEKEWDEHTRAEPSPAPTPGMSINKALDILKSACGMSRVTEDNPDPLLLQYSSRSSVHFYARKVNSNCVYKVHVGDNSYSSLTEFAEYVQKTKMRCVMAADGNLRFNFPKSNNSVTLNCDTERVDIEVKDDGSLEIKTTDKDSSVQTIKADNKGKFDGYSYPESGDPFKVAQ